MITTHKKGASVRETEAPATGAINRPTTHHHYTSWPLLIQELGIPHD
jgi:hypothetical protein